MKHISELFDQLPPSNIEAERWVVGSIILKPDVLDDIGFLQPGDFYDNTLAKVFGWLHQRHHRNEPIDAGLLGQHFQSDDWAARIAEIVQVPAVTNVAYYARLITRAAKFRYIREIAIDALRDAHGGDGEPEELLDAVEARLASIGTTAG